VVLRAFAWRPVVAVASGDRGFVESSDRLEVGHAEGEVHVRPTADLSSSDPPHLRGRRYRHQMKIM
jgi:hypothetical protein